MPTPSSATVNPLRDPRDRRLPRIAGPCGMVILGVTGDLARTKLMPAIDDLANRKLPPPGFSLVGFARRDWADQDFARVVRDAVRRYARTEFREETWRSLAEGFRFVQGDFEDDVAFAQLTQTILDLDELRGTGGSHAFSLSIPPRFFRAVVGQLEEHGLTEQRDGAWRRVVVQKPFGHDLRTARELNEASGGSSHRSRCSASITTSASARCWPQRWTSHRAGCGRSSSPRRVSPRRVSPSADLLDAWVTDRPGAPVKRRRPEGIGITGVRWSPTAETSASSATPDDPALATLGVPAQPDRPVALRRRPVPELLAEELRRLDADEIHEATVGALLLSRRPRSQGAGYARSTASRERVRGSRKATRKIRGNRKAATR